MGTVIAITPTANWDMALCEDYMARQTVQPDHWIVADGGDHPAVLTMGQQHLFTTSPTGVRNFARNIINACDSLMAEGLSDQDILVCVENDDWYRPDHIETCIARLQHADATGCTTLRYYHVPTRQFRVMANRGSALCQTALRASALPWLMDAAHRAHEANDRCIDRLFWQRVMSEGRPDLHDIPTVVGIKHGDGLGVGHRPGAGWSKDPHGAQLRAWIGADADAYL